MEIIMPGKLAEPKGPKIFKCSTCGCIFKCFDGEYKAEPATPIIGPAFMYEAKCPTCGKKIVTDDHEQRLFENERRNNIDKEKADKASDGGRTKSKRCAISFTRWWSLK